MVAAAIPGADVKTANAVPSHRPAPALVPPAGSAPQQPVARIPQPSQMPKNYTTYPPAPPAAPGSRTAAAPSAGRLAPNASAPSTRPGSAAAQRVVVAPPTGANGGPLPPKPVRAFEDGAMPRTVAELTKPPTGGKVVRRPPERGGAALGGGEMTRWQPQTAWRPAGMSGVDKYSQPYSQPWFRQGQGALDACVKELREMRALVEVRTNERDQALALAQEANEMYAAMEKDRNRMERERDEAREAASAEGDNAAAAFADAQAAREEGEALRTEMAQLRAEKAAAERAADDARKEMEAASVALQELAKKQLAETAAARRAEAELAAATELAARLEAERAAEKAAAERAEEEAAVAAEAAAQQARADDMAAKLREMRGANVMDDTRELVERQIAKLGKGGGASKAPAVKDDGSMDALLTKFNDPEEIFKLLEGGPSGQGSQVALIRASWLRAKQPRFLPANKADLPPEAFIYASELRKIYRQIKGKPKLLPIISVLHPFSSPMTVDKHPDLDGGILGRVIETLDARWDQFTRKRGTAGDSGVADLGVFFDWCALEEPTLGRSRTLASVEDFGLWYAHELLTVWMLPERREEKSGRLLYTNGWSAFEYIMATTFRASTDLSGYMGMWPQLLDLSEELDSDHNERCARPPPHEPLALDANHELGDTVFLSDGDRSERDVASKLYQKALFEMLGTAQKLTFTKLCWADADAFKLALVLPMCSAVTELNLSCNLIGDRGALDLAESLGALPVLEVLNLSSNQIGDPGASRLAGALTDGALQTSLKKLLLDNNSIGDKGALTLAGAISGGALLSCKSVGLKGNPASAAARKSVTKALKKSRGPPK